MRLKDYRAPESSALYVEYDCLIAQSNLEDLTDGGEWGWEE